MNLNRLFQYRASRKILPVGKQNRRFFCLRIYRINLFLDMEGRIELAELEPTEIERRVVKFGFLRHWCRIRIGHRRGCCRWTGFGSRQNRGIGGHFARARNGRRTRDHFLWLFFEKRENHDLGECSDHH